MTAVTLGAQEADEKVVEAEEEAGQAVLFECGFDIDFYSAYVWRNAVQNDRMVLQPSPWVDVTFFDLFWVGGNVWQNYDLSDRRGDIYRRGLTETDYNLHIAGDVFTSDDEKFKLNLEFGHDWYYNQFLVADIKEDSISTREFYLKAVFSNPVVDVYGQVSWMYRDFGNYKQGLSYELGFTREYALVDDVLVLGADWNVNFGDSHYLYYLFGGLSNPTPYEEEGVEGEDDDFDRGPDGGIGGTTLKIYLGWNITDWAVLKGTLAYTGLVNGDLRQAHGDYGDENRDLVWGGLSLNFAF